MQIFMQKIIFSICLAKLKINAHTLYAQKLQWNKLSWQMELKVLRLANKNNMQIFMQKAYFLFPSQSLKSMHMLFMPKKWNGTNFHDIWS